VNIRNGFFFILISLFMTFASSARVMEFKVSKQARKSSTFKEACEAMGFRNNLLVESKGLVALDCMGRILKVNDYCAKQVQTGKAFLRGFINKAEKKVVCQYGNSANLSLSCETKKTRKYCESPVTSCRKLKNYFARDLEVTHHSRLFKDEAETLNCYFGKLNLDVEPDLFEGNSHLNK